jgi:hypothetical protein
MVAKSNQVSVDKLINLRNIISKIFRKRKGNIRTAKLMRLYLIIINKIRDFYRDINELKKGYQPRINIIRDENGNLIADPQNILNRWKNFFNQVLNLYGFRMSCRWIYIRLSY